MLENLESNINDEVIEVLDFDDENKLKLLFNKFKKKFNNKNISRISLIASVFILVLIIVITFSFASLTPVKSVDIYSENLDYINGEEGAWKVTKSSYWTDVGRAEISFDVNSVIKPIKRKMDVILVIDTSASMVEDRLSQVKAGTRDLINNLVGLDSSNQISLISFNTTSTILSDFTRDVDILTNQINALTAEGNTNYYQALNSVDELLSDYVKETGKDCVVVFLTDGYANENIPNEIVKASELKIKYSYIKINSISYEMGDIASSTLASISDSVYVSKIMNVKEAFYKASVGLTPYSSFVIEDYINSEYFEIVKTSAAVGEVEITEEDGNSKIVWNLGENYLSGTRVTLDIEIKLKDEYLNTAGVFQTNTQEVITSTIGDVDENVTSSLTPVIADNYMVTYDGNAPDDCTVTGIPKTVNHSVFTTVGISDEVPTCSGYKFKGWKVVNEGVTKLGNDYFVMPEEHVTVKAEWANIKLKKSMAGDISEIKPLYDMMASNSVADNIPSQYVTSSTGINFSRASSDTNGKGIYMMASTANDEYPIYYYRGAVENNNVKFADFCWKMVRTTDTGGVKLIYNGLPDSSGGCTGVSPAIGESKFNNLYTSLADVGYMYGTRYEVTKKSLSWSELAGKNAIYKSGMTSTNFYYGDSVSYDYDEATGKYIYTLTDATQYLWSSNYKNMLGKYTCLSESETSCDTVGYVVNSYSSYMYYVEMSGGETYNSIIENLNEIKWVYGNDVEYKDIDGDGISEYILIDTYESSPVKWSDEQTTILSKYKYTCWSEDNGCEQVYYIYYSDKSHIVLSNGKKIDVAVKEMLSESSNVNNSTIKEFIDSWYEKNLIGFTDKLEDTVWCNDRRISSYGGWDKDSGANILYFTMNSRKQPSLTCNLNDSFTVEKRYKDDVQVGNGNLTYPIALVTYDEFLLSGGYKSGYIYNGNYGWTLTPYMATSYPAVHPLYYSISNPEVNKSMFVRPAISLKKGTKATSGDGSAANPYVIGKYYSITVTGNDNVYTNVSEAVVGQKVTLKSKFLDVNYFKVNGEIVNGDSFIMPKGNVEITEVVFKDYATIESEHNPYPSSLSSVVYGEKTFEGATSLTVTLEYSTGGSSDYFMVYSSPDDTTGTKYYGGYTTTPKNTETITINSNYIKIVFRTDGNGNNYYGFKATIVPNYS